MIAAVHQDPVSMPTRHLSSMFEIMPESIFCVSNHLPQNSMTTRRYWHQR
jgi:hypothetical protein